MLKNADAQTLIQDARTIHAEAEALLSAGDWRNASEKGWLAATAATAALIWSITGVRYHTETDISSGLRTLAYQHRGEYDELSKLHSLFTNNLLCEGFYDGFYYDDIPGMIHDVAGYIALAERLAGNGA